METSCDGLVRTAFASLQLVVSDFLHSVPPSSLLQCINAAAKFGNQKVELNISLTAVEILWNISDFIFHNYKTIETGLSEAAFSQKSISAGNANIYVIRKVKQNLFESIYNKTSRERPKSASYISKAQK